MESVKYLVLGGGISGLSFSHFKSEGYMVLEKESELGGYCRTIYQDGYIWDYAGHFFHFRNPDIKSLFEKLIDKNDMVESMKTTNIFIDNGYIDFPFQKNIHQLAKDKFIDCIHDLIVTEKGEDFQKEDSFLNMLYSRFGKSITEYFLKPYNEKLYAIDLNELDADAMGRFFPYADVQDIVKNFKNKKNESYNDTFLYPKSGAKAFVNAIAKTLDQNRIKLEEEVLSIDLISKTVTTNKSIYAYDKLINTLPLPKLIKLCGWEDKSDYSSLTSNKVLVQNLGFDKPELNKEKYSWTYISDEKINFYRIGYYSNILNENRLSMYVEIGFKSQDIVDVDKELTSTISNLKNMGVIDNTHNLVSHKSLIMDPAYVHISKRSENTKKYYLEELAKNDIFSIGRYGLWTYCSIEDNMIQAKKLCETI